MVGNVLVDDVLSVALVVLEVVLEGVVLGDVVLGVVLAVELGVILAIVVEDVELGEVLRELSVLFIVDDVLKGIVFAVVVVFTGHA